MSVFVLKRPWNKKASPWKASPSERRSKGNAHSYSHFKRDTPWGFSFMLLPNANSMKSSNKLFPIGKSCVQARVKHHSNISARLYQRSTSLVELVRHRPANPRGSSSIPGRGGERFISRFLQKFVSLLSWYHDNCAASTDLSYLSKSELKVKATNQKFELWRNERHLVHIFAFRLCEITIMYTVQSNHYSCSY